MHCVISLIFSTAYSMRRMGKELFLVILCIVVTSNEAALRWEKVTVSRGSVPGTRRDFGFGYWNDEQNGRNYLVVFGGRLKNGLRVNDVWLFDVNSKAWQSLPTTNDPPVRYSMVSGVIQSLSLFIVSMGQGPDPSNADSVKRYADVWALDLTSGKWNQLDLSGSGISARYGGHGGTHLNSSFFWVGGGFADDHQRYSDTFRINFEDYNHLNNTQLEWESVHPGVTNYNQYSQTVPHARCLHASTLATPQDLVIFGGCMSGGRAGGPCPSQDSWHFSLSSGSWKQLPFCSVGRAYSAMAPLLDYGGEVVVLYGGIDAMNRQILSLENYPREEVMVLNSTSSSWTRLRSIPDSTSGYPQRREGHGMVATEEGVVYMFGGRDIEDDSYYNDVWVLSGNISGSELVGSCSVLWFTWLHMHGLFNALAWVFIFPTGVLVARYCKKPGSTAWFWAHRILQIIGVVTTFGALVMVLATSSTPTFPHALIGIILLILLAQQPINGFLRAHKKEGEPKTRRRVCWEGWHKSIGYILIALGFINCILGSLLVVAPQPVWIVLLCVVAIWVVVFVVLEGVHMYREQCRTPIQEADGDEHELRNLGDNPEKYVPLADSNSETKCVDSHSESKDDDTNCSSEHVKTQDSVNAHDDHKHHH